MTPLRGRLVSCWSVLRDCSRACWSFARTLSTDSAYEHYLDHHRRNHPERPVLNRREFYLRQQSQKWSGVQRCC